MPRENKGQANPIRAGPTSINALSCAKYAKISVDTKFLRLLKFLKFLRSPKCANDARFYRHIRRPEQPEQLENLEQPVISSEIMPTNTDH